MAAPRDLSHEARQGITEPTLSESAERIYRLLGVHTHSEAIRAIGQLASASFQSTIKDPRIMHLNFRRLTSRAIEPTYATDGACALDLYQMKGSEELALMPGQSCVIGTGLAFEVPDGMAMVVLSRSGHGFRYDVQLANSVALIDRDYRGEVMLKLTRLPVPGLTLEVDSAGVRSEAFIIRPGDRIAQMGLIPMPRLKLVEVGHLSATARGTGGLGSTGA